VKVLLADIGGTHVRLALGDRGGLVHPKKLKASDFKGFEEAVQSYLNETKHADVRVIRAATAAWPDPAGIYTFSNLSGWDFDPQAMRNKGYDIDRIYNDFEASSYGALSLKPEERKVLFKGNPQRNDPVIICGPGTGLGLAYALPEAGGGWRVQATFGAHMLPGAHTDEQAAILAAARKLGTFKEGIKAEHMASGRGLPLLHRAVCNVHGLPVEGDTAEQILAAASRESVRATLNAFHQFLGIFIHNAVVTTQGYGGVYLNGGMIDRLVEKNLFNFDMIHQSMMVPLIEYIDHIMKAVPVYYVSDPFLALKGLLEVKNSA
jgi:glucokinase